MRLLTCALLAVVFSWAVAAGPAAGDVAPWHKGVNLTAWWHNAYEQPRSDEALRALAATGTTRVAIVTTWYMDAPGSSTIHPVTVKSPSDASVLHAMSTARSLGMDVVLKPHVDVLDGSFRADIAPADRSAWFDSYRLMSNHYAELAAQGGAAMVIVGTELTSMSTDEAEWRRTIAEVHSRFGGELTFAANWIDGATRIGFWDALDYIGVDAYMPLAATPDPSVEELTASWRDRGYVRELEGLHERHGKPVMFTELGYQSRVGTAMTPWGGATGPVDQGPQARAYEAAFRAFWDAPWFAGIYWWDWSASGPGDQSGHPIAGKAAQNVLSAWYALPPRTEPAAVAPEPQPAPPATAPPAAPAPPVAAVPARATARPARVALRVWRGRRLEGTVLRHGAPCRTRVTIRVSPLSRGARKAGRGSGSARTTSAGRFRFSLRRLPAGRYRAAAVVADPACGRARSVKRTFRTR